MRGSRRSPSHPPASEAIRPSTTTIVPKISFADFKEYPRTRERNVGIQTWIPTFLSRVRGYSLKSANEIFGTIVVVDGLIASLAGGWLGDRLLPRIRSSYYFVSAVSMALGVPVMIVALFSGGHAMIAGIW